MNDFEAVGNKLHYSSLAIIAAKFDHDDTKNLFL